MTLLSASLRVLAIASSTLFASCATPPKTVVPPASCADILKAFAPDNGKPLGDGGVIAIRGGLDGTVDFLIIVSDKQAQNVLRMVKEEGLTLAGGIGKCAHPESGYVYNTVRLSLKEQGVAL